LALSKYNPSSEGDQPLRELVARTTGRAIVLVPGQVEDDASVRLGCAGIRTNSELLELVRAARPEAFILYKPHPDVVSKNRRGALAGATVRLADHIETRATLPACLAVCSEVHTLTSLVGFEALLRGLSVFTYGQPFYSSWGLTTDRVPVERRTRRLELDELVAGTLLRYPVYYSFRAEAFVTAEDIVFELERDRQQLRALPAHAPRVLRQAERLGRWLREVLGAR
ncbi:MAG TPA: hypothetical protein VLC09_12250, partial [Polyangiaceae bacterium]|nr:hypothetical protein [Polyangiaceae bacterium]